MVEIFKTVIFFFLLMLVLGSLASQQEEKTVQLYVLPEDNPALCPTSNMSRCLTLNGYIQQATSYFHSHTIFSFLPGIHSLNRIAVFENISNVSLTSFLSSGSLNQENHVVISCSSDANTGLYFRNITELSIDRLTFSGCGHSATSTGQGALSVHRVTNFSMNHITVYDSIGHGLYVSNVFGISQISHSNFSHNIHSGNLALFYENCSHSETLKPTLMTVASSFFGHGICKGNGMLAAGIYAMIWCTNINLEFNNLVTFNNTAPGNITVGGNIAIILRNRTNLNSNKVLVINCLIEAGSSYYGGGLFLSFEQVPLVPTNITYAQLVTIESTNFTKNSANREGGGLYIITHDVINLLQLAGLVNINNCLFNGNTVLHAAGAAIHINSHNMPGYVGHIIPQYQVRVNRTKFTNSSGEELDSSDPITRSAMFVFHKHSGVYLNDCTFKSNNVTGLAVGASTIIFSGNTSFERNVGFNGGGMLLSDNSYMYLTPNTTLSFIDNHALSTGGGIYVSAPSLKSVPDCFFQFNVQDNIISLLNTTQVYFENNTAEIAGSAIYGGSVDYCVIKNPWAYTPYTLYGYDVFDIVFVIHHKYQDYSYITSDPYEVCFCIDSAVGTQPYCNITAVYTEVYPGATFTISVVTVGQRDGTVPGVVNAIVKPPASLNSLQTNQEVKLNCTPLHYTVNSPLSNTMTELRVEHPILSTPPMFKIKPAVINISLKNCPLGFSLFDGMCMCAPGLINRSTIQCVLDPSPVVNRFPYCWVGYYNSTSLNKSGFIYYDYCPANYCQDIMVSIPVSETTFMQNVQCRKNREGMLCGKCTPGTSAVFGSSSCKVCSNRYLSLIIAFVAAGIALVAFLNLSKMTVTNGEINGLIFYANIMKIIMNETNFDRTDSGYVLRFFIAWLNLDLGIETCFYNGMDSYAKVFLQFAFPLYLFLLAFLIIYLCRRYKTFAMLMGRNSVKILATLFFLSYAKLLHIIISIFSATTITYPDGSSAIMWMGDPNIAFGSMKHMALIAAGLLAICFSLPYTFIVTFHQCMQRSNQRCFHWIHRFKPLLDAYGAAYKDKYRFWTGLLLFARLFIFAVLAYNIKQIINVSFLVVLFVCLCVLSLGWILGGVYKCSTLDALEVFYLLNLSIFSAASLRALWRKDIVQQNQLTNISIGLVIIIFLSKKIFTKKIRLMIQQCLRRFRRQRNVAMTNIPPQLFSASVDTPQWETGSDDNTEKVGNSSEEDDKNMDPFLS